MHRSSHQVLTDFIANFSIDQELYEINNDIMECWTHFVDGSSNFKGSGVGIVMISQMGNGSNERSDMV